MAEGIGNSGQPQDLVTLLRQDRNEEALRLIETFLDKESQNADLWQKKGIALRRLGKRREAVDAYDKAIALSPDHADAWFNRGIAHKYIAWLDSRPEAHQEAIRCYRQALRCEPEHLGALVCLGNVSVLLKKPQEGKEYYGKAIACYPDEPVAWCNHGFAMGRLGDWQRALEAAEKCLTLNPRLAPGLIIKSACLKTTGKDYEARFHGIASRG